MKMKKTTLKAAEGIMLTEASRQETSSNEELVKLPLLKGMLLNFIVPEIFLA